MGFLQSITIYSPGYFFFFFFNLLHFSHCELLFLVFFGRRTLALVMMVTAPHTSALTRVLFCAIPVTYEPSPFRLKFLGLDQRPEFMLLLPFLLHEKSLFSCSFSLLKVRNSKPRANLEKNTFIMFKASPLPPMNFTPL